MERHNEKLPADISRCKPQGFKKRQDAWSSICNFFKHNLENIFDQLGNDFATNMKYLLGYI